MNADAPWARAIASFDPVLERFRNETTSFTEEEALGSSHWELGEDARLREDARFRPTPWRRWILAERFLANDAIYERLRGGIAAVVLNDCLASLEDSLGRKAVVCSADPRLVFENGEVRLSARELSDEALAADAPEEDRFETHLPLVDLDVTAASMARGEWGRSGSERETEVEGWLRVSLPGRGLNDRMFVARIRGDSMDDGKGHLVDGAYVVFERDPHGTRAGRNVLVYSQLLATGGRSWALKRYVPDQRGSDGRHERILLVSLNPDKNQYPDIELRPAEDEDVQILALVAGVLDPSSYTRKPKAVRPPGRRDLASEEAQRRIRQRMREAAERFFADLGKDETGRAGDREEILARFVCLDADAGGLHVEAGPLEKFPPFVKKLLVVSGEATVSILASNLRSRTWRFRVEPSTADYVWTAGAQDELLGDELGKLRLPGLAGDRATAFRVDAAGIGKPIESDTLSLGETYRLLVPPALDLAGVADESITSFSGNWKLVELHVPSSPGRELRRILKTLGFHVGTEAPTVTWVGLPPKRYAVNARGESYPQFGPSSCPTLLIEGVRTSVEGALRVFLVGENDSAVLSLPAGESWLVSLDGLESGRYLVEIAHERTSIERVRTAFALDDTPATPVPAVARVELCGELRCLDGSEGLDLEGDYHRLPGESETFGIEVPPLWNVEVSWEGERCVRLGDAFGSSDGRVASSEVLAGAVNFLERERVGDLRLDFAELGVLRLRHTRRPSKSALRHELAQIASERSRSAADLVGQFPALRSVWLEPVLQRLGYVVRDIPTDQLGGAPHGVTALVLDSVERDGTTVVRRSERVAVLFGSGIDTGATGSGSMRAFASDLCARFAVHEAVLTDGISWIQYKARQQLARSPKNLPELLVSGGEPAFEDFLADFASERVRWS